MEHDDLVIEDILEASSKKKKVDGKKKGNRTELKLVKILTERFGKGFSRSVGSGNRWGQVSYLPKHAQDVFSGDLIVPQGFKFCFECKGGYDAIDIHSVIERGKQNKELSGFLKQAEQDGQRCGRMPIMAWTRTRKPWVAFLKFDDIKDHLKTFKFLMFYDGWVCVQLDNLLKLPDDYFLDAANTN
jgi:hypothetical protein